MARRVSILALLLLTYLGAYLALRDGGIAENLLPNWVGINKGHFTHAAIVLSGVIAGTLIYGQAYTPNARLFIAAFLGLTLLVAFASWHVVPISKIYATPSWGLFSILLCTLGFMATNIALHGERKPLWLRTVQPAAENPLLYYLIPYFLAALFGLFAFSPRPEVLDSGLPGVLWSLLYTGVVVAIGNVVSRAGLRLRL